MVGFVGERYIYIVGEGREVVVYCYDFIVFILRRRSGLRCFQNQND